MNDAQILTHPAFDRPPVLNGRRHGSPPRGVPMLDRVRRARLIDEASLRAWAREHANEHWTLDQIREEKQRQDARGVLERRNDKIWQEIEQLSREAVRLTIEVVRLRSRLIDQQLAEQQKLGGAPSRD